MKRHLIIGIGIMALLAGLLFSGAVSAETPSVRAEYGRRENLAVLECNIQIDEASDTVVTRLILENTGRETVRIHYTLPLISAGVRPGTLELSASDDAERTSETEVYFSLKPQGSIVFSYSYQTKNSLSNAGAFGMDLTKLIFGEGGRIGRFAVAVSMKEEDLPLIDEIFPVNYCIDGCWIFVELYDFTPSSLLDRFYIAKETYRNLKGGRDFEPNEEQQAVLENYRQWFREGIGVAIPGAEEGGVPRMFAEMIGAEITPGTAYLQRYMEHFSRLEEGNIHFQRIVSGLILREMIWQEAEPELIASFFSVGMTDSIGPAVRELLRQAVYGDEMYTVAVGLTREPALAGVTLHKAQMIPGPDERFEWVPAQEITLLAAEPSGFYHVKYQEEYSLFRTIVIRDAASYGDDELRAYLETVGVDVFARQMLLDDREDQVEVNVPGSDWQTYDGFFSCPKDGPLNAGDLLEAHQLTETNYLSISVSEREDAFAASLSVPAFTHYIGLIYQEDDETHFFALSGAEGYLSAMTGLPFYRFIADCEKGLTLRQAAQEKRAAKAAEVDGRIRPLEALTLQEVPFYESGDCTGLYMLAFDMEIWEESDKVTTRLLLENSGGASVTACLPLPVLRNGAAEGSLNIIESGGEAALVAGNRIYLTLPPGGILSLSYRYLTASRLIHAGAVALDLSQLVFVEGGRVGRFSAALTLREEDIPLVTEIFPLNYRFDGRTVSLVLYDFAPNRLLNRFSISKDSYRNLMGSRDWEPTDAELYILAHYRKWFREGLPLPEDAVPDDRSLPWDQGVFNDPGCAFSLEAGSSALYPVMLHLCLRTLQTRGLLTKDWVNTFLLEHRDVTSLAPLTRESLKQIAFADEPVLAAVEYAAEPSLAGVPLYVAEWRERRNGEEREWIREFMPVNEGRLLRAVPQEVLFFNYKGENLRVMMLSDVSDMPAVELQDTLDALGISLYIRTKLMDNREGAYGTLTYSTEEMPEETRYRNAYFSLPQGSLLTREALGKALRSFYVNIWDGDDYFDIQIREDSQLAALTIPAFTQYAGIVETEEEKAMVTIMTFCSNPLDSDYGLKDYRAILSGRETALALADREAALAARRDAITEKIEKALNAP